MLLPTNWATPEDFATLFQYFWHKDFPIDPLSPGAKRTGLTIPIGIVVQSIADLIRLVARRHQEKQALVRENGAVLAPTRLRASDEAVERKVFEMLQNGVSCGSWFFGLLEALTAS